MRSASQFSGSPVRSSPHSAQSLPPQVHTGKRLFRRDAHPAAPDRRYRALLLRRFPPHNRGNSHSDISYAVPRRCRTVSAIRNRGPSRYHRGISDSSGRHSPSAVSSQYPSDVSAGGYLPLQWCARWMPSSLRCTAYGIPVSRVFRSTEQPFPAP